MAHRIQIEQRGSYLFATVTGDNTPHDVQEYLAEIREACLARGCPRVLIEENLRGASLGTMAIYDIVTQASQRAGPALQKIAYLDVNPEHAREGMEFAENVAVNRLLNVRLFADRHAAEEWVSA